jgi:hypothetical protein
MNVVPRAKGERKTRGRRNKRTLCPVLKPGLIQNDSSFGHLQE